MQVPQALDKPLAKQTRLDEVPERAGIRRVEAKSARVGEGTDAHVTATSASTASNGPARGVAPACVRTPGWLVPACYRPGNVAPNDGMVSAWFLCHSRHCTSEIESCSE